MFMPYSKKTSHKGTTIMGRGNLRQYPVETHDHPRLLEDTESQTQLERKPDLNLKNHICERFLGHCAVLVHQPTEPQKPFKQFQCNPVAVQMLNVNVVN